MVILKVFKLLPSQLADWPKCPSSTIKSNSNKSKAPEVCFLTSHTCRENWCALNFHYYDATAQYTYLFGKTGFKNWHMDVTYMTSWSYLNVSLIRLCCWNIQKHTWKTKMEWWFQLFHWFVLLAILMIETLASDVRLLHNDQICTWTQNDFECIVYKCGRDRLLFRNFISKTAANWLNFT